MTKYNKCKKKINSRIPKVRNTLYHNIAATSVCIFKFVHFFCNLFVIQWQNVWTDISYHSSIQRTFPFLRKSRQKRKKYVWNKKGGNFLISKGSTLFSSKVCAITRECEHIRPQFSGPKAFVDLTSYHPLL